MSNLIITIISIALAAIVALFGIYYGGQAYNNYAIKSQAQTVISQMSQLYNAGVLYLTDTGQRNVTNYYTGAQPATNLAGNFNTLLIPKYLSSMPIPFNGKPIAYGSTSTTYGSQNIALKVVNTCNAAGEGYVYGFCGNAAGKNYVVLSMQKAGVCVSAGYGSMVGNVLKASDKFTKIALEINKQTTIPANLAIDSTTQLPIYTNTSSWGDATSELVRNYCPGPGVYEMDNGCMIRHDFKEIICFFSK